jgi:hypothetical protein
MQQPQVSNPFKKNPLVQFSTPEHKDAGDQINLTFLNRNGTEVVIPHNQPLPIFSFLNDMPCQSNNLLLSYGDILALAGDYFAAKEPIATAASKQEGRNRFLEAYNSLATTTQATVKDIFKINQQSYVSNPSLNEYIQQFLLVKTLGMKYFNITNNNLDHFEEWSTTAYQIGHTVALEMAVKGYALLQQNNFEQANYYLNLAYQMNAFACHFLSDSFSSGHMRELTLRKDMSAKYGVLGGILINSMHDEDNKLGVNVTNRNGDIWTAYGDDSYATAPDSTNRKLQYQALQASADEIYQCYRTGLYPQPAESKVTGYIPVVNNAPNSNYDHPQYAPMFKSIDNKMMYRNPLNELDPNKVNYKELNIFNALFLAIKMRFFSVVPQFTPAAPSGSTTGKLLISTDCDLEAPAKRKLAPAPASERSPLLLHSSYTQAVSPAPSPQPSRPGKR